MMQGEREPNIPDPIKNQMAFIEFMTSGPAMKKWMTEAAKVIKRNEALLSTIGKAADIEKLHAEAAELRATVLSAIETREVALKAGNDKLKTDMSQRNAAMNTKVSEASTRANAELVEARAALTNAKALEDAAKAEHAASTKALAEAERQRDRAKELRTELETKAANVKALAEAL